jgi:hypothetical protein
MLLNMELLRTCQHASSFLINEAIDLCLLFANDFLRPMALREIDNFQEIITHYYTTWLFKQSFFTNGHVQFY